MADIVAPEDCDAAVAMLPLTQFPFGAACVLTRELQSVLFHYDVKPEVVAILAEEDITSKKQVRFANPDGLADAKLLFDQVSKRVKPLQRLLLKRAFRRMLSPDPFAAVSSTPASSSSAAPAVAAAAPPLSDAAKRAVEVEKAAGNKTKAKERPSGSCQIAGE